MRAKASDRPFGTRGRAPRRAAFAGALALIAAGGLAHSAAATTYIQAVDPNRFRVCADPSNLPFSNKAGEGFENKIAELFAEKLDRPLVYTWFPQIMGFVRNTLNAKKCDVIMGVASGSEQVLHTNPYYRTTYVMVYRKDSGIDARTVADLEAHEDITIGTVGGTPPDILLSEAGLADRIQPYTRVYNTLLTTMGDLMVEDLKEGTIDVAVMWGPIAGYWVDQHGLDAAIVPLLRGGGEGERHGIGRLDYYITMGVRAGEIDWKRRLNELVVENRDEINAILREYGVPLLKLRGEPEPLAAVTSAPGQAGETPAP